jgi:PIN domain nuclease of toxin-antitoxin system
LRVLLDTQAFLWYCAGDARLSNHARAWIEDRGNERLSSAASLFESAIQLSLGKLSLSDPFDQFVSDGISKLRCIVLDLTVPHLAKLSVRPFHHRDPFDRMLVA